jgi:hypothetical protein
MVVFVKDFVLCSQNKYINKQFKTYFHIYVTSEHFFKPKKKKKTTLQNTLTSELFWKVDRLFYFLIYFNFKSYTSILDY